MLSVIIPTRDKAARLRLCLRALAGAVLRCGVACEVVVVNDGSRDQTGEVASAARGDFDVPFRVLTRESAGGRSVARNLGAASSEGGRLLFLDDDMLIGADALRGHGAAEDPRAPVLARATILHLPWLHSLSDPSRGEEGLPEGIAARLLGGDAPSLLDTASRFARRSRFEADLHRLLAGRPDPARGGRWLAATGGNLSVPREFFIKAGGFDERMGFGWGAEDIEFGFRAEKAGAYVLHLADVKTFHMDHATGGRVGEHEDALRYFGEKHGERLGRRLSAYFSGELDVMEVGGE